MHFYLNPVRKVPRRNVDDRVECCYDEKYSNFCSPLKLSSVLLSRPSRHWTENEYWPIIIIIFHHIWFKSPVSAANKVVIARKGFNVTLIPPCQEGYISYNLRLLGNQRTRIDKKLQQGRNSSATLLKNDSFVPQWLTSVLPKVFLKSHRLRNECISIYK